ncbi:unnamed protein product [Adineta steineri]|uniref:TIR domain-containing protein n=1 Tax=Adineta steineri TaxID=433720 RepID=A0A815PH33_9BILA|nr:unnamed protein product [Adineta steineri]CAF1448664.1 unnamed protein product [Adineta steineri]
MADKNQYNIQIFGEFKLVNDVVQQIQDLVNKYRLTKYQLKEMTSTEIAYLLNVCQPELKAIEKEFQPDRVQFHIRQNAFYAPPLLKDEIESRIQILLSHFTTNTFKTISFYSDITERTSVILKIIAANNRCHYDGQIETILQTSFIPKANESSSIIYPIPKYIKEYSDVFCSSPMFHQSISLPNGSIEVLIDDIASQKVDTIVIPSISYGLKDNLLERAGNIIEQRSSKHGKNSIPFIIETTAGRLPCKKILFVNWSLSTLVTIDNEKYIRESVKQFMSKVIEYIITTNQHSNIETHSVAFAVLDSCTNEKLLAEAMISESVHLIQSFKGQYLKILHIFLSDQRTLHKQFLTALATVQTNNNSYATLNYPISSFSITLTSSKMEYLMKCEEKLRKHLSRSMTQIELNGFDHWDHDLINAFYKYCNDLCVLPDIDEYGRVVLKGSIISVHQAKEKYQLTTALVKERNRLSEIGSSNHNNIVLSYCHEDSLAVHSLANRLIDEGFRICLNSNEKNDILLQMIESDCIIICISENYGKDTRCENQVKYASQTGKPIILVKLDNCKPINWLRESLVNRLCFPMFGSKQQFDLVFDRLLLEIFQYVSPAGISLRQEVSHRIMLPRENYIDTHCDDMTRTCESRNLINSEKEKVEDIIHEIEKDLDEQYFQTYGSNYQQKQIERKQQFYFEKGILPYRKYLEQILNFKTKQNILPFAISDDINDAPFPMFDEVRQNPNLFLRNSINLSSLGMTISYIERGCYTGYCPSFDSWNGGGSSGIYGRCDPKVLVPKIIRYFSLGVVTNKQIRQRLEMIDSTGYWIVPHSLHP